MGTQTREILEAKKSRSRRTSPTIASQVRCYCWSITRLFTTVDQLPFTESTISKEYFQVSSFARRQNRMMITMTEALDSLAQVATDQLFGFDTASLLTPQLARQVPLSAEDFTLPSTMDEPTNIFGEPIDFHESAVPGDLDLDSTVPEIKQEGKSNTHRLNHGYKAPSLHDVICSLPSVSTPPPNGGHASPYSSPAHNWWVPDRTILTPLIGQSLPTSWCPTSTSQSENKLTPAPSPDLKVSQPQQ